MADTTAPLELPLGVTESKVLQQIARIESQLRKVQRGAEQEFVRSNAKVARSFGAVSDSAGAMSRSTVSSLQNVSFQLQDIFVQIQGGQGVARALSQQMPQLLSGFGLAGAAAGLAAAALTPLIAGLVSTGEEAVTADKAMGELEKTFEAYSRYVKVATTDTASLVAEYGKLAGRAREASRMMAEVVIGGVRDQAKSALGSMLGDLERAMEIRQELAAMDAMWGENEFRPANYTLLKGELEDIGRMFGLTGDQALVLADKIQAAFTADSVEGMSTAAYDALQAFQDMGVPLLSLPAPLAEALGHLEQMAGMAARAAVESERLHNWLENARLAISDLVANVPGSGWLSGAIGDAVALAQALWNAASAKAAALAQSSGQTKGNGAWYEGQTAEDLLPPKAYPGLKPVTVSGAGRKGGSGGGGRAKTDPLDKLAADTSDLLAQTAAMRAAIATGGDMSRALELIEQTQRLLNEAQRQGIKITPEYKDKVAAAAAAFVDAKDQMADLQSATAKGEEALQSFFGSILEGADAAKQALASLLAEMAKAQFSKGVMTLLGATSWGGSLISGIGSMLANANGNVFSGPGIGAYSGQVVSKPTVFPFARGIGLMGEAGPEAILPLSRINGKLGVRADTRGDMGSGPINVTVTMDESTGQLGAYVRDQAGRVIAQAAPRIVGQAVGATYERAREYPLPGSRR